MMGPTIRILIANAHDALQETLASKINTVPDLELVGQVVDDDHILQMCAKTLPDVVLIDLETPRNGNLSIVRYIRERCPHTKIIALTHSMNEERIAAAHQAEIHGYLHSDTPAGELTRAIRNAYLDGSAIAPEEAKTLMQADMRSTEQRLHLTSLEQKVLHLLADGMTNAQIAQALGISLSLTEAHINTILTRLNASSRAEAVTIAQTYKLIAFRPTSFDPDGLSDQRNA